MPNLNTLARMLYLELGRKTVRAMNYTTLNQYVREHVEGYGVKDRDVPVIAARMRQMARDWTPPKDGR